MHAVVLKKSIIFLTNSFLFNSSSLRYIELKFRCCFGVVLEAQQVVANNGQHRHIMFWQSTAMIIDNEASTDENTRSNGADGRWWHRMNDTREREERLPTGSLHFSSKRRARCSCCRRSIDGVYYLLHVIIRSENTTTNSTTTPSIGTSLAFFFFLKKKNKNKNKTKQNNTQC